MWVFFGRITRDLPRGRAQVGDRHLKFNEDWDNLKEAVEHGYLWHEFGGSALLLPELRTH